MKKNYIFKLNDNFYWKRLLFTLAFSFFTFFSVKAQVVVNPGAGSYGTLKGAFDAINAGTHTGAITIALNGDTVETASAVLNESGNGAASYTSIIISPSGGATRTISGSFVGHLIDLNGADNVTFDGLNSGGNALVLSSTALGASSVIRFVNDATNNVVTNTSLLGAGDTSFGVVYFGIGTTNGNDNNNINNCVISASASSPLNGIYSLASAAIDNSGNTINSNLISNFFNATAATAGLNINTGNNNWTITNNRLFQTASRTYTTASTHNGIFISSGSGHTISGNTIGYATSTGTGVYQMGGTIATRFIAINLGVGTASATSVQGNTITAISLGTSSGATTANGVLCGINVTAGNVNIGNVIANTIGSSTGVDSLIATPTTTQGTVVGINTSSTGIINISNNLLGGFTSGGAAAAIAGGIIGINVSGVASSLTINNNIIGNTTANNMRGGTLGLTTGSSLVSGINMPSAATQVIVTNNTIRNMASFGTGTTGFVRGIWTAAATGSASSFSITGNNINNLTSNNASTSISNGQTSVAGICLSVGTNGLISQNTIHSLSNINTGTNLSYVAGITNANATNTTISKNSIYNLSNAGTSTTATAPAVAVGIVVRSGTTAVTIVNNMISLGNSQATNTAFIGIQGNHGSTPDPIDYIYHNTINIEGVAASGAQPSFGIARTDFSATARTVTMDIKNNIINNTRTGGTGSHYAIGNNYGATATATGWATNASNYNVLNANAATIGYWNSAQTFANWKTTSLSDANSLNAIPVNFVNSAIGDLHLNMGTTPTQMESGAIVVGGVITDYDNQARPGPTGSVNGGAALPDIGADEFDGVPLDLIPPTITYSALSFTCDGSVNRTLTATISDVSGVPTSGIGLPVLYWRINSGTWNSATGIHVGGSNYSFGFGNGALLNDVVSYYIVAQDNVATPNVGSFPSAGATGFTSNPPAVSTSPTTPSSYTINGIIGGIYTVGVSGAYPTLTAAVAAYNVSCITGPVTFSLIDATYPSETFPITITANAYASSTNTLTINPAVTGVTISGSSATSILNVNGGDYIIIDGSVGSTVNSVCPPSSASRDLTFSNTNTGTSSAVIWLNSTVSSDSATNNTVKNCVIVGNAPTTTLVGIGAGGATISSTSAGASNNNISFINNDIRACQFGIYSSGANATTKNQNFVANQNIINSTGTSSVGLSGIYCNYTNNVTVSGNTIGDIASSASQDIVAINLGFAATSGFSTTITGNADGVSNATITNNSIGVVTNNATFSAIGIGLGNTISGTNLIANNMISGVAANSTSPDLSAGIVLGGGTGATTNVYHNTVVMQGALPGSTAATQASACLAVTATTAPTLDVKNNIFVNTQVGNTGATTKFEAIGLAYTSTTGNYVGLSSNNNLLYAAGAGPGTYMIGVTNGITAGTTRVTLADWQTETGRDASSLNTNPVFISASNLHLVDTDPANAALASGGTTTSVTIDFDCESRNGTNPAMGADEFVSLKVSTFDKDSFKVYPNPVQDIVTIEYTSDITNVEVYNLMGQQLFSKKANAMNTTLDMSKFQAGTYLVKVTAGKVSKTIKVIKR